MLAALRQYGHTAYRRLKYRRIVERMHIAVCTACQYDCLSCSHEGLRYRDPHYHLTLDQTRQFTRFTESSGYFIEKLHVTGPGDPLLWNDLHEGLRILRASPALGIIEILTNGIALDRLDRSWEDVDRVCVSVYPATAHLESHFRDVQRQRGEKLVLNRIDRFRAMPARGATAPVPCRCDCSGPMYFDGKIFLFCGPTVFGAADSKGVSPFDYPDMYCEIGPGYLDTQSGGAPTLLSGLIAPVDRRKKMGTHELCRYCFANLNFDHGSHPHMALKGRRQRRSMDVIVPPSDLRST